jgi:acetyltransferase-like isoleucine patch superfamily enzyme
MGARIGKGTRIKIGTILLSRKIIIGENVKIGPFVYISANEFEVNDHTKIKPLSVVSATKIHLGKYVHISPLSIISGDHTEKSIFKVGNHSRFFPFCWVDTGEGVEIGNNVGIGGHTLIFTHGVWSDYLDGAPVTYGPVKIEDNVWLPWRVFVMPNVTIGKDSIIGANSTITKSISANVIAAGSPAKKIKDNAIKEISNGERLERALHVLSEFSKHYSFKTGTENKLKDCQLILNNNKIVIDDIEDVSQNDIVFLVNKTLSETEITRLKTKGVSIIFHHDKKVFTTPKNLICSEFIQFLRKYGIRLDI